MNALWKTFSRTVTGATSIASQFTNSVFKRNDFRIQEFVQSIAFKSSLYRMHRMGDYPPKARKLNPLDGKPFAKGIVLKTLIRKPKKPNSANRKCVLVKLSTGKEMIAFVPGEGHNLQEHNIVLCRVGKLRDCPGVKIRCIRGKYDLPHVKKTAQQ